MSDQGNLEAFYLFIYLVQVGYASTHPENVSKH